MTVIYIAQLARRDCGKVENESCGDVSFQRCYNAVVRRCQDVATTLLQHQSTLCKCFLTTDNSQLFPATET